MTSSKPLSVLLAGIGGYGATYLNALLDEGEAHGCRLAGVVDPAADRVPRIDAVRAAGVPVEADLAQFYRGCHEARPDLTVVSTPIHCHVPQTIAALEQSSHVLCEKPVAARIEDVHRAVAARDRAGREVAIGYQWCYSTAVQTLKADILSGRFGAPRWMATLASWPRSEVYYDRNAWAGAIQLPDGTWVFDSPANNALSHYLHHMFYLLGDRVDASGVPVQVTAELYRTNRIGNYDTAAARCTTDRGVEVLFYVTHAAREQMGPRITCVFEQATVEYDPDDGRLRATTTTGSTIDYGDPQHTPVTEKLWQTAAVARGETAVVCGLEAASAQTLAMNGMQSSAPTIVDLPGEAEPGPRAPDDRLHVVPDLLQILEACRADRALPSERHVAWARPGRPVDLRDYDRFPAPTDVA